MENTKKVLAEWEKKFACPLCERLPEEPQLLRCTHSFCKDCIAEFDSCPKCGFRFTSKDIVPNDMLTKLLNFMRVSSKFAYSNHSSTPEKEEEKVQFSSKIIDGPSKELLKEGNSKNESDIKISGAPEKLKSLLRKCDKKNNKSKTSTNEKKEYKAQFSSKLIKEPNKDLLKEKTPMNETGSELIDIPEISKRLMRSCDRKSLKSEISTNDKTSKLEPKTPIRKKKSKKGQNKTEEGNSANKTPKFSPKSFMLYSAKKAHCANKVNSKGETRLQIACRQGKLSLVLQLLEKGAETNVKDYAHWTPLCDAVNNRHIEVVRALLRAGACVNTPTQYNTTALVEAVVRRDKEMVRLLMLHGADMNQRTALDNTALSLADDEIKAILLAVKDVPIQPHVQVALTPRTILISQLPQEEVDEVMELCKRFNLTLTTVYTPDTTHVVVPGTEGGDVVDSFEAMIGLASGCCVVVFGWVTSCLEAQRLIPVDGFEPAGTPNYPDTHAFTRARVNREKLLPRLFDGSHVSLQHNQQWPPKLRERTEALAVAAGARFQTREMDAERIPADERTVMFHVGPDSPLASTSHLILYRPSGGDQPPLKYNMQHIKSLPVSWFMECINTFNVHLDPSKYFQT